MDAPDVEPQALARLVALVQRIVDEGGNPVGFDARAWTLDWLAGPCLALGMARPADYMQKEEGRGIVETLLRQIEAGAYS